MGFEGFPAAGLRFLAELADHNDQEWFTAHRSDFVELLQKPAIAFVEAVGIRLRAFGDDVRVDTRTNGAGVLMRINRDTRFSQDKSPYKTNVAGMWWIGDGKKTASPAYGFQLERDRLRLMAGMFAFSPEQLRAFRDAVDSPVSGDDLVSIVEQLEAAGFGIHGEHYKRVPREYPADHPRERLLRFDGLYTGAGPDLTGAVLGSPELVDLTVERFEQARPLVRWLAACVR